MKHIRLGIVMVSFMALLSLSACSGATASTANTPSGTTGSARSAPDDDGTGAAVNVIRRYYRAINQGDYARAYEYWGTRRGHNASGKTKSAFVAGFAHTKSSHVQIGTPQKPEGAAGSVYVTVPVQLTATLDSGKVQHFAGVYVLRRVDSGTQTSQHTWHLYDAALNAVRQ